ncbi:hypothetical protein OB955_20060 [Halobacteria archaeon AArc-m2/3/4]|uniref:CARDB domain-containing protein n=1 Tax=Natronoglomus mannanivorans TaxID=2979990 RepID=A0ABT2QJB4_9EURY|nr:hypothetical protein [Halobacteria archaeon AArc-m2/3/4]
MDMQSLVLSCLLVLFLLVPTVAITLEDDSSGAVELEATSQYAEIDKNGKLELDFQRLNRDAITNVDNTFTVQVNDETIQSVWIESGTGVTFYTKSTEATIHEGNPIRFDTSRSEVVGIVIDTHNIETKAKTFTIHVEYEEDEYEDEDDTDSTEASEEKKQEKSIDEENKFETPEKFSNDIKIADSTIQTQDGVRTTDSNEDITIKAGQQFSVDVTFENTGNTAHTFTGQLEIDGVVFDTYSIELKAGESITVPFQASITPPGTYTVSVNGQSEGTVTIIQPKKPDSPQSWTEMNPIVVVVTPLLVGAGIGLLFSVDNKQVLFWIIKEAREAVRKLI